MALSYLEKEFLASTVDPKVAGRGALYERAYRFMGSKDVRAFALEEESLAVRNAYGDTEFGRGCLVARRLLEAGVRCIEVVLDGWDTHQDNLVRTRKLGAALDSGLASLLKDLKERHLLDSTTVVCLGDFGRTPTINRNEGRDHHAKAWSALAAGGRLRRGHVHGETDATGTSVVRGKVTVPDFMATLFHSMGLPFDVTKTTPAGRPLAMTDGGVPVRELLADPG
jgi:uncharacterized protein (DUF1501 family)